MNDMQAFMLTDLFPKLFEGITDADLTVILMRKYPISINVSDVDAIRKDAPTKKQYAHALRDLGFSPSFIKDYLHLHQTTVSYHLATNAKPYKNKHLQYRIADRAIPSEKYTTENTYYNS